LSGQDDKQRRIDTEQMRKVREEKLATRKRAAFRVLDAGGTWSDAAVAASASHDTVKMWAREAGHPTVNWKPKGKRKT
jgi:gamma-glutamyltranspeptidase